MSSGSDDRHPRRWPAGLITGLWAVFALAILLIAFQQYQRIRTISRLSSLGASFTRAHNSRFNRLAARLFRTEVFNLPTSIAVLDSVGFHGPGRIAPADFEALRQFPEIEQISIEGDSLLVNGEHWPALPPQIRRLFLRAVRSESEFDAFLGSLGRSPNLRSVIFQNGVSNHALKHFKSAADVTDLCYGDNSLSEQDLSGLSSYRHLKKLRLNVLFWKAGTESTLLELRELEEFYPGQYPEEWLDVVEQHPTLKIVDHDPKATYIQQSRAKIEAEFSP